jgi:hypothetical protein
LNEILCEQEDRQVGKDSTVAFNTLRLQIPPSPLRAHFTHARAKVRQYHAVFHGQRCLGRYDDAGVLKEDAHKVA